MLQNSKTWIVTTSGWQRIKIGFKRRGWEGRIKLDQVKGREITRNSYILPKKNVFLPFEGCYTVFLWPWFIIYMLTSFIGYADDSFHFISNFDIQKSKFGRKSNKFDGHSINNWTLQGSWGSLFATPGDPWHLVEPGQHQVSRAVMVRIVEGKSRVEALLSPGNNTQKLEVGQSSTQTLRKTQTVTKFDNSNYDKAQQLK